MTRADEIKQELANLKFKYNIIGVLGCFFFPLWFCNIPLGKRINELNKELWRIEGRPKIRFTGYNSWLVAGVIIGIMVLGMVVEVLK